MKEFFLEIQILFSEIEAIIDECKKNKKQEQNQIYKDRVNDERNCTRQFFKIFKKGLPDGTELKNFESLFIHTRLLLLQKIGDTLDISDSREIIKFLEEI